MGVPGLSSSGLLLGRWRPVHVQSAFPTPLCPFRRTGRVPSQQAGRGVAGFLGSKAREGEGQCPGPSCAAGSLPGLQPGGRRVCGPKGFGGPGGGPIVQAWSGAPKPEGRRLCFGERIRPHSAGLLTFPRSFPGSSSWAALPPESAGGEGAVAERDSSGFPGTRVPTSRRPEGIPPHLSFRGRLLGRRQSRSAGWAGGGAVCSRWAAGDAPGQEGLRPDWGAVSSHAVRPGWTPSLAPLRRTNCI